MTYFENREDASLLKGDVGRGCSYLKLLESFNANPHKRVKTLVAFFGLFNSWYILWFRLLCKAKISPCPLLQPAVLSRSTIQCRESRERMIKKIAFCL